MDKQVEEMEKTLYDYRFHYDDCIAGSETNLAEFLVNHGWIKPVEGAVVLTREEAKTIYETLKANEEAVMVCKKEMEEAQEVIVKEIGEYVQQVRKETAEKFAERLKALEEALLDMVVQFCQMGEEGKLKHAFMSAEEQAFDVLDITYGENVSDVYERFNKKWDRPIYEIAKEITEGENDG